MTTSYTETEPAVKPPSDAGGAPASNDLDDLDHDDVTDETTPCALWAAENRELVDAACAQFPAPVIGEGRAVFVVEPWRADDEPYGADLVAYAGDLPRAWNLSLRSMFGVEDPPVDGDAVGHIRGMRPERLLPLEVRGAPEAIEALAFGLNRNETCRAALDDALRGHGNGVSARPAGGARVPDGSGPTTPPDASCEDPTRAELSGAVAAAALVATESELHDLARQPGAFGDRVREGLGALSCTVPAAPAPDLPPDVTAFDVGLVLATVAGRRAPAADLLARLPTELRDQVVAELWRVETKPEPAPKPKARAPREWTVAQLEADPNADVQIGDLVEQDFGGFMYWSAECERAHRERNSPEARAEKAAERRAAAVWIRSTGRKVAARWTAALHGFPDEPRGQWLAMRNGCDVSAGKTPREAMAAAIAWHIRGVTRPADAVERACNEEGGLDGFAETNPFDGVTLLELRGPAKAAARLARSLSRITL